MSYYINGDRYDATRYDAMAWVAGSTRGTYLPGDIFYVEGVIRANPQVWRVVNNDRCRLRDVGEIIPASPPLRWALGIGVYPGYNQPDVLRQVFARKYHDPSVLFLRCSFKQLLELGKNSNFFRDNPDTRIRHVFTAVIGPSQSSNKNVLEISETCQVFHIYGSLPVCFHSQALRVIGATYGRRAVYPIPIQTTD